MLRDVNLRPHFFAKKPSQRLTKGVYQSWGWNFEMEIRGEQVYDLDYPELGEKKTYTLGDSSFTIGTFPNFGVCDSPEQLLSKLPRDVIDGPTPYVVSMVRLDKANEPGRNWRWHKWGAYIGDQEPTQEYLFDEPVIETVWTYHVNQLRPEEVAA